jgi:uncharacterized membrane protein
MDTYKLNGLALATLAAALFATAPLAADQPSNTTGKCFGVNSCKGKSSCKSSGHGCKSQNACKGQGFVMVTKDTCDQIGGRFEPK